MKTKIVLIILLLTGSLFSQVLDSVNWQLTLGTDGRLSLLQNRTAQYGIGAGNFKIPFMLDYSKLDTAIWQPFNYQSGYFNSVINKATFYGHGIGTVRAGLFYLANPDTVSISHENPFNAYGYLNRDSANVHNVRYVNLADSDHVALNTESIIIITAQGNDPYAHITILDSADWQDGQRLTIIYTATSPGGASITGSFNGDTTPLIITLQYDYYELLWSETLATFLEIKPAK